jgi:hypothetical protein
MSVGTLIPKNGFALDGRTISPEPDNILRGDGRVLQMGSGQG